MTRQKWFDNQTPEVQEQFKMNCDALNEDYEFEDWLNQPAPITNGIYGAFRWANSKQGYKYWDEINAKYLQD